MAQVGIESLTPRTLDGLSYSNQGRNLKTWWDFEDFLNQTIFDAGVWVSYYNGAGAYVGTDQPGTALRPGWVYGLTGTTAAGYAGIDTSYACFRFGGGVYTWEADFWLTDLSTGVEEFAIHLGFGDTRGADQVDGAYFKYDRTANVNWLACTANNSTRTATDTGVAVASAAWNRFKVVVNALGTAVNFYINNVLVATNTTNIPTGAGRETGARAQIVKSVGITGRMFFIDWLWLHVDLTASR